MNNVVIGAFEDNIEKATNSVSNSAKNQAQAFMNSVKGQVAGSQNLPTDQGSGTNEQNQQQKQNMSNDQAKQFLRDLYGKTDGNKEESHPITEPLGIPAKDPDGGKSPEDLAKMNQLRSALHQDYYQNLVNRPKAEEKPVIEKLEEEKQLEEIQTAKKEEEKPGPLQTVKTGTAETNIGVAG